MNDFFSKIDFNIKIYLNLFNINRFLFNYEIKAFIAYIKSLYLINYINFFEKKKIINSLFIIKKKFLKTNIDNINLFLEKEIINFNGELGNKIFFKINKNFQNIIIKLMLKEEIKKIHILIIFIRKCIIFLSKKYFNIPLLGLIFIEYNIPITLGHYLLSWNEMFKRDHLNLFYCKKECDDLFIDINFLTNHNCNINQNIFKKTLNFKYLTENYIDSVNNKDYICFFFHFCNNLIIHLSKICEDLIFFNNEKINFIELSNLFMYYDDILYKKINILQLIKSKIGRLYGNSINILTLLNNQVSSYNNYQEDKECLFDNIFTIKNLLNCFRIILPIIKFNKKNIYLYLLENYCIKNDIISYLIKKGVTFENSYLIFKNCEKYCIKKKINFFNISLKELKLISNLFKKDIFYFISVEGTINRNNFYGNTNLKQIIKSIQRAKFYLNNIILKFND
ncbi:putative argininosuccinate lyase [Candidatus Carsonella ruddii HT isolate Thao2000]|uniref:Putative argininosuccinate lyase n=1 Tax=Candidatus Carsonella ruddii HT isolate Thao2000 TaxID=1202539 RepID=J3VQI1_CARRU|nr:lyase family protein [Candidatus Carsonella ruddii]AFP84221.1 putative argininosuccinate lyase [Candidatus Carsonella ruddii HT isolate Thao2000]